MKTKRAIFIGSLIVLFIICYSVMNEHFDPLARYKYADDSNRDLIIDYLSEDDINYLIDRQLTPEEFMPYFGIEGFTIRYVNWYNLAKNTQNESLDVIVKFVNTYLGNKLHQDDLEKLLSNYSYATLSAFYEGDDEYTPEGTLVFDPNELMVKLVDEKTLYKYVPSDLVKVETLPVVNHYFNDEDIYLRKEAYEALNKLCEDAYVINQKTYGNMILVGGFLSYEQQEKLYDEAMLMVGKDDVLKHAALPGHMENQLGTYAELVVAKVEEAQGSETETKETDKKALDHGTWLSENAAKYGFVLRENKIKNPGSEKTYCLRYVGSENALAMKEKGLKIEEMG